MSTEHTGSVANRKCTLYRLDLDGSVSIMDTGLGMPNGLVWSLDNRILYLTDSPQHVIYAYDFDPDTGSITNRRPFVRTDDQPGVPDGLTTLRPSLSRLAAGSCPCCSCMMSVSTKAFFKYLAPLLAS